MICYDFFFVTYTVVVMYLQYEFIGSSFTCILLSKDEIEDKGCHKQKAQHPNGDGQYKNKNSIATTQCQVSFIFSI